MNKLHYIINFSITKILLIGLFLLSKSISFAQQKLSFSVKEIKGEPVENIQVRMETCHQKYQKYTDRNGNVSFLLGQKDTCKEARVHISNKFYMPIDTTIIINYNKDITIFLKPNTQQIQEVSITAYKPIGKISAEKSVFSINKNGFLKNAKADLAMHFIPGTEYKDGLVYIVGKGKPTRYKINGVNATAEDLKQLKANDIEQVEVMEITKDDDAHYQGEINIIKKNPSENKIYGETNFSVGLMHPLYNNYDALNLQTKHIELVAGFNWNKSRQDNENRVYRRIDNQSQETIYTDNTKLTLYQKSQWVRVSFFPSNKVDITIRFDHSSNPSYINRQIDDFDNNLRDEKYREDMDEYSGFMNARY